MNSKPSKNILVSGLRVARVTRVTILAIVATVVFVATVANTGTALGQSTSVARIEGESDKSVSLVTIGLSNRPSWGDSAELKIEDHGTFVQVMLPETVVPSPGTFLDANSPVITKIAAFQVTDESTGQAINAAIRLFVNQDAAQVRQALVAELLADRVVITLDHKRLQTINETAKVQPTEPASTPAGIVLNGNVATPAKREPSNAAATESLKNGWSSVGIKVPNLAGKLAVVSGFSLFMLILLGITQKWRKIRRSPIMETLDRATKQFKHRVPASENGDDYVRDNAPMELKTITTMTVAPRQKLALMQAGPETLLLSITPNGIQFLTKIGGQTSMESLASHLLAAQVQANPIQKIAQTEPNSELKTFADRLELASANTDADHTDSDDDSSPGSSATSKTTGRQGASTQPAKTKVRVAITDDGITNIPESTSKNQKPNRNAKANNRHQVSENSKPSDDITRMIREKLRNLPVI